MDVWIKPVRNQAQALHSLAQIGVLHMEGFGREYTSVEGQTLPYIGAMIQEADVRIHAIGRQPGAQESLQGSGKKMFAFENQHEVDAAIAQVFENRAVVIAHKQWKQEFAHAPQCKR